MEKELQLPITELNLFFSEIFWTEKKNKLKIEGRKKQQPKGTACYYGV